ncbi:GNAT family N-acetyltransferase [Pseudoalteromonas denitrificans]|jgi:RimJ/RimL family protein N-acetyltransferase|uniref:Protein N-acetyltransferase, RimJ/RimL family n=1 Tax=Pseudoalteromonas denitrificans DSM 6059 TaxID=1123010 RepID=A0A1I1UFD2_9GAMM|nr:GNAT family protein [Pseudoalteromonas denitrificans]SFD69556.1 Protein N-acetyltransferase, RimJ/RimL family [Pseudoalteromonas denitrificans DSM 6059]
MWLQEQKLMGECVILEPLSEQHIDDLALAVKDGEAWKLWFANVPHFNDMATYVKAAMNGAKEGDIVYAIRAKNSNKIVGTTRYYGVDANNKRALIGYTWYSNSVRRTAINTECKLLLLKNLFETHEAIAVEFRTHFFNQASRNAIQRLGAKQDGILRNHQIMKDGSYRDTVIYSIIASEWPAVKCNLINKMCMYE